jgi:hypothetical protein
MALAQYRQPMPCALAGLMTKLLGLLLCTGDITGSAFIANESLINSDLLDLAGRPFDQDSSVRLNRDFQLYWRQHLQGENSDTRYLWSALRPLPAASSAHVESEALATEGACGFPLNSDPTSRSSAYGNSTAPSTCCCLRRFLLSACPTSSCNFFGGTTVLLYV